MVPLKVKNIEFGTGIPKVCVPLVGRTFDELENELKALKSVDFDLIEWRIDFFKDVEDKTKLLEALDLIRTYQTEAILLVTFRTIFEGGNKVTDHYQDIYIELIKTEKIDFIDVELFLGDELFKDLLAFAHHHQVKVIASNHDFSKTPSKKEILDRFKKMSELKADILKIALMPNDLDDVLTLLSASHIASKRYPQPIITMSMSKLGFISRVCGEAFGSCVTFGSVLEASAPGQIQANKLKEILNLIDEGL